MITLNLSFSTWRRKIIISAYSLLMMNMRTLSNTDRKVCTLALSNSYKSQGGSTANLRKHLNTTFGKQEGDEADLCNCRTEEDLGRTQGRQAG